MAVSTRKKEARKRGEVKIDFDLLDKDQKAFIKKKVKELGSLKEVEKFYHRDDTVSAFANHIASERWKKKKASQPKKKK